MRSAFLFAIVLISSTPPLRGETPALSEAALADFKASLTAATTKHLDLLIDSDAKVAALKGKGADGATAMAFYQMFELTKNPKYRTAALALADKILKDMKATKHGVLYIKEKDAGGGEAIAGGGPPAFGWYTAAAAYIFHKEGGRNEDLKYIATVIDKFPWNAEGWWANTIDIKTGEPKEPITKAGAINKSAAMAMCAGMAGEYVKAIDPALAARLKAKVDKCLAKQILPAQEPDGFWHYGFKGNDPKNKDVIGYFMVTTHALLQLRQMTTEYRDPAFTAAMGKACAFALKEIAPMTDPNKGATPSKRASAGTPAHYTLAEEPKRGFQLGVLLFAGKNNAEGVKLMDAALKHFPHGNAGADGAHAVQPSAIVLSLLAKKE